MKIGTNLLACLFMAAVLTACSELKSAGRDVGHATRDATRTVGHGARDAVKSVGDGIKKIGQ